jgi:hypothetical protein
MAQSKKKKWIERIFILLGMLLFGIVFLLNFMAYNHAYRMLHFAPPETPLPRFGEMRKTEILKIVLFGFDIPKPSPEAFPEDFGLEYETLRIPGENGIELEAWYVPVEDATTIALLFHGYANEKSSLLGEAAALHEMGISALLVDFRGSGGSNRFDTSIGYYESEDVRSSFDYAQGELPERDILFYGQSMGRATVLRALATQDWVAKPNLIILESVFDRLFSTVGNRFESIGWPTFPLTHLFVFWGGYHGGFPGFDHNPVDYAGDVDGPVLMLHGTEDNRASLAQAETVFENLKGPKELVRFEGQGHGSLIESDPDRWKQAVGDFLREQASAPKGVRPENDL